MTNCLQFFPWIVSICSFGGVCFMRMLLSTIPDVFEEEFNVGPGDLGNLFTIYFYIYVAAQIPVGMLIQHVSVKYVILVYSILSSFALFMLTFSSSFLTLSIWWGVFGFVSSPGYLTCLNTAALVPEYVSFLIGMMMMLLCMVCILAQFTFSFIWTWLHSWRIVAFFMASWLLLSAILAYFFIPVTRSSPQERLPLVQSENIPQKSSCGYNRWVWLLCFPVAALGIPANSFAPIFIGIFDLQIVAESRSETALAAAMPLLGLSLSAPFWGRLIDRTTSVKSKKVILTSGLLLTCVLTIPIFIPNIPFYLQLACYFLCGVGAGCEPSWISINAFYNKDQIDFTNSVINMFGMVLSSVMTSTMSWEIGNSKSVDTFQFATYDVIAVELVAVISCAFLLFLHHKPEETKL